MAMIEEKPSENALGFKLFGKMIMVKDHEATETDDETSKESRQKGEEEATAVEGGTEVLPCPRCKSRETKFCYFNNYSVNQPRHFCRACYRYWTAGGTLRNVPFGAGRRKSRPFPRAALNYSVPCVSGGVVVEHWLHGAPAKRPCSG